MSRSNETDVTYMNGKKYKGHYEGSKAHHGRYVTSREVATQHMFATKRKKHTKSGLTILKGVIAIVFFPIMIYVWLFKLIINWIRHGKVKKITKAELKEMSGNEKIDYHAFADSSTIAQDERPYYKEDSYYTLYAFPDSAWAKKIELFSEQTSHEVATVNGLYQAELELLLYCKKGDYPKPRNGYPSFWWFKYGIRDVGHALESLDARGFIQLGDMKASIPALKVENLKQLLKLAGLPCTGKKDELVERVIENFDKIDLKEMGLVRKYQLTELGIRELDENKNLLSSLNKE